MGRPTSDTSRYNRRMIDAKHSRQPPPIEVRGRAGLPLGMSPSRFLRDYWQKRPLLIRQAFAHFTPPLDPDDLAGLACEDGVLSRLIVHDTRHERWHVKTGPLQETDFAQTPASHWTLLVQDVDKWDMDVAQLLKHFRFLPSWRVDDIMVSYAEDGGGVGPHVDQYDVFLLQGIGQRRWAISTDPAAPTAFRPDVELKQLMQFEPTREWLLEPGDMLYLPPGVPHDGVAFAGPCMTLSIGMRAPSQAELIGDLADYVAERLPDEMRYTDPDLKPAVHIGEIDRATIARLRNAVPFSADVDDAMLMDWFGRFITRYRNAHGIAAPDKPLSATAFAERLKSGTRLVRHPWTRMAWSGSRLSCTLYASGQAYSAPAKLAQELCAQETLIVQVPPDADDAELLRTLLNDGHLILRKSR